MKEIKVHGKYLVDKEGYKYGNGAKIEIDGELFNGDTKEIIAKALEPQPYKLNDIEIIFDKNKYYCYIRLNAPDGEKKKFVFEYLHSDNGTKFVFTENPNLANWRPETIKEYFCTIEAIIKKIEFMITKDGYDKKEFKFLFK